MEKELFEAFKQHIKDEKLRQDHFLYHGQRYVKCEKCGKITRTEDCMYYGGDGNHMFLGGCRKCFSRCSKY